MLHARGSRETLGLARIAVFTGWLIHVLLVRIEDLADIPVELVEPAGVLGLLPEAVWPILWTPLALWLLKGTLLGTLTLLVLGTRGYRPLALVACVLLTLFEGLPRSFGFVNHAQLALLYAAYLLAPFPAADGLSVSAGQRPARSDAIYRAPLVAVSLFFLLGYALVGIRRVCIGGLEIFINDTILYQVGGGGVVRPTEMGLYALECPLLAWMLRVGYPIINLFEVLAPCCLFSCYFRWVWIAVMVPFHLGTWVLMGIFFPMSLLIIAFFLLEWSGALARARNLWPDGGRVAVAC